MLMNCTCEGDCRAPEVKTMAMDDWQALAVTKVGAECRAGFICQVHAGDLDGDGLADDAVVKLWHARGAS